MISSKYNSKRTREVRMELRRVSRRFDEDYERFEENKDDSNEYWKG